MEKNGYSVVLTCVIAALCLLMAGFGLSLDREREPAAQESFRVEIAEDCGVYGLTFSNALHSGGVTHADGSPLTVGGTYGWEAGSCQTAVTVAALDKEQRVIFETTVLCDLREDVCTVYLTAGGFSTAEGI